MIGNINDLGSVKLVSDWAEQGSESVDPAGADFAADLIQAAQQEMQASEKPVKAEGKVADQSELAKDLSNSILKDKQKQSLILGAQGAQVLVPQMAVQEVIPQQGAEVKQAVEAKVKAQQNVAQQAKNQVPEYNALTNPKAIGGMTTAANVAGLTPWGKDWVMDKKAISNPELKTLFGEASKDAGIDLSKLDLSAMRGDAVSPQVETLLRAKENLDSSEMPSELQGLAQMGGVIESLGMQQASPLAVADNKTAKIQKQNLGLISSLKAQAKAGQSMETGELSTLTGSQAIKAGGMSGAEFLSTLNLAQQKGSDQGQKKEEDLKSGMGADLLKAQVESSQVKGDMHGFGVVAQPAAQAQVAPKLEVTGHVAQGAMAQDRLTSESLVGLGTGIRGMSAQGGGEIRIRLKPENLGEIHLKVVTHGNDVGLQIQANSEKSKQILEASMSSLKETLAGQNLNLGRVELTVAQSSNAFGSDMRNDHGSNPQMHQSFGNNLNQGGSDRSNEWSKREELSDAPSLKRSQVPLSGMRTMDSARAGAKSSRLDITA